MMEDAAQHGNTDSQDLSATSTCTFAILRGDHCPYIFKALQNIAKGGDLGWSVGEQFAPST